MSLLAQKQQAQLDKLELHRQKLEEGSYDKVAISQLESVKKEPKLQEFIENGSLPLEIEEYKKDVYIYALVKNVHNEKEKRYVNKLAIQTYEPSYIQRINSSKNKINLFVGFDSHFLLHDPKAKPKVKPKAK